MKKIIQFFIAIMAIATCGCGTQGKKRNPNLLIIQTDEHNFRTLGCYRNILPDDQAYMWGPAVVETPYIDRLAEEGALCSKFYATTPVCSPSRSSFMSGMYPQNTPVVDNSIPMYDHVVTFAEILKQHGYATGYAGKWHLDGKSIPGWAPSRNFGFDDNRFMYNRGHWKMLDLLNSEPVVGTVDGKPSYIPVGDERTFTTDWLCDRAIDFMDAHKDQPFCYMVSIPDPHDPDVVREPYSSMFDNQDYSRPASALKPKEGLPGWGRMNNESFNQSGYYGMVKCIDDNVGKILSFLERNEMLDNTIVVFTSDHGDLRGEHGRNDKGVPYEASCRIPFIIRWPEKIEAGIVVPQVLGCTDFLPTILGLMDVPATGNEEGRDASSIFTSGEVPENWQDILFVRGTIDSKWVAAFTQQYKLIYSEEDDPWFFDLSNDPNELLNQYDNPLYTGVIREMSLALMEYGNDHNDPRINNQKINSELEQVLDKK
jgi:uncharacterized sulfatase